MDHFTRLKRQVQNYLITMLLALSILLIASWWLLSQALNSKIQILAILIVEAVVLAFVMAIKATSHVIEPVKLLWQAIVHVSPGNAATPAPNLNESKVGRELITSLCLQIYQFASSSDSGKPKQGANDIQARAIATNLPIPLFVMDKNQVVIFANEAASKYLGINSADLTGKNLYNNVNLLFSTNDTFDTWLSQVKTNTVTATHSWEHVRLIPADKREPLQFDMAAYYNKQAASEVETIITLFDRTSLYKAEDSSIDFVALAVHELRTPLTLLRGYIEVFEEELDGKLSQELASFLNKMQASAQQLASLVNNILNVSRVEADQLTLQLKEESWNDIVTSMVNDIKLRAGVKGKTIELKLADILPTVAVDRVSIYEVLSNLLDNAIKYSSNEPKIIVQTSVAEGGQIETTIQDFGIGIASSVVPHLFERFYRSHRTEQQVGGTGLGLYLSKAIISAHGGHIWIRSKEGNGTTVGFTLKPYAELADELKNSDNKEITRNAYGWIKNHSLYRR